MACAGPGSRPSNSYNKEAPRTSDSRHPPCAAHLSPQRGDFRPTVQQDEADLLDYLLYKLKYTHIYTIYIHGYICTNIGQGTSEGLILFFHLVGSGVEP